MSNGSKTRYGHIASIDNRKEGGSAEVVTVQRFNACDTMCFLTLCAEYTMCVGQQRQTVKYCSYCVISRNFTQILMVSKVYKFLSD